VREKKNAYRILVRKPEGKRPLGSSKFGFEDNIKICLQSVGWEGVDWVNLAQVWNKRLALLNAVMNFRV
jgi:hypothetical protein